MSPAAAPAPLANSGSAQHSVGTPPLLLGAVLAFWGWQAELLWLGLLAGGAVEAASTLRARWNFPQADLDRIWNLCMLLFFGAWVLAFATTDGLDTVGTLLNSQSFAARNEAINKGVRSVLLGFVWMPLTLLPIVLTQAVSACDRMDWSTFSWWLRRQRGQPGMEPVGTGLNVSWPYFVTCLVAASAANDRSVHFSIGLVALAGWALWTRRPRHSSIPRWAGCMALAMVIGFAAQLGLRGLQQIAQRLNNAWMARLVGARGIESNETRTLIGTIGRLKLSGTIVLHVEPESGPAPALLRETTYNLYRAPFWASTNRHFDLVAGEKDLTSWPLLPDRHTDRSVIVSGYLPGGHGTIPLPHGAARIENLPVGVVEANRMGMVRVDEGPGFMRFRARYSAADSIDSRPGPNDLDLPGLEKPALSSIVDELQLSRQSPATRVGTLQRFFNEHFTYSTWLSVPSTTRASETALAAFLLKTRSGHCEYFATATVLLLRQSGIPARYAVGYAVDERQGDRWIVRERHAHAWCLAWIDGRWQDVDLTPPVWTGIESAQGSFWERVTDLWSRMRFAFSRWRWGGGEWRTYAVWFMAPLLGFAGWRLTSQKQWSRARPGPRLVPPTPAPGRDSEFYHIEKRLAALHQPRRPGESLPAWLQHVTRAPGSEGLHSDELRELDELLALHYRLRFDPQGLPGSERAALARRSEAWLDRSRYLEPRFQ